VVRVDLLDLEDGERAARLVGQCHLVPARRLIHREADGKRPREAVREPHLLDDALVVLRAHEALERREGAGGEHVQIRQLARREDERLEVLDALGARSAPLEQLPAVRLDQLGADRRAHAVTSARISPRSSRTWRIRVALSAGSSCSDSMRTSGLCGGSYGSETPVNSLISPRKAFSYRPLTSRRAHSSTDASTNTSTNVPCCSTISRALRRASTYGEIAETITAAPCRVSREAT